MNDSISKALDVTPVNNIEVINKELKPTSDTDFDYARGNLINIIEKGNQALDGILDVADMSQHPRGYEVVATLINSLASVNKDLVDLNKKKKELDQQNNSTNITNNLFVGSTAELQKLLKENAPKK
jgi:hypothetical protein